MDYAGLTVSRVGIMLTMVGCRGLGWVQVNYVRLSWILVAYGGLEVDYVELGWITLSLLHPQKRKRPVFECYTLSSPQ